MDQEGSQEVQQRERQSPLSGEKQPQYMLEVHQFEISLAEKDLDVLVEKLTGVIPCIREG